MNITIVLLCVFLPFLIMFLTYKSSIMNKVGSIIIAYIIGCILGITGIIPDTEETHSLQTNIASATIPMAIPLLLLSSDIRSWSRLAPKFIKSTVCGLLGCAVAICIGFFAFGQNNKEMFANIGGMLSGLYTGGNANLASLKVALGVEDSVYIVTSAYSTILSAIYLFFVIIVGKRILKLFMPDFKEDQTTDNHVIKIENYNHQLFY